MKPFLNFICVFATATMLSTLSFAQTTPTLLRTDNTFVQQRIEGSDPAGWLYFKADSDLRSEQLFSEYPSAAGLSSDDSMVLIESEVDEQGNWHNRYQQYHKNIKVEGGEIFEHLKGCYVDQLHGRIIEGLNINAQPNLTESQARNAATAYIGATEYAWEDTELEQELKDDTGDPNATYFPTGSLTLTYLPGTTLEAGNYRLAWRFEIYATIPHSFKSVYVNANTGAILRSTEMEHDNGPAGTLYDGIQTIDTEWYGGLFHGHHHLVAGDNEKNIETRNGNPPGSWKQLGHVFDNDDVWGLDAPTVATTGAHWVVTRSWDFFRDTYGRKGMDNNNKNVRVIGNYLVLMDNATYSRPSGRDLIAFGTSTAGGPFPIPAGVNWAALDIGGHEFAHGVTFREANLVFEGESGALNESFSDIFGTMVERFARGGTSNFTLGEDLGFVLRDMQTPAAGFRPQPRTYLTDPLWMNTVGCVPVAGLPPAVPAGNDLCGVHINSGVQNRWFFLLSQGGTQGGVAVQGIGMDKAARIAYVNLCTFLGTNSNHPAARLGAIAAARQLYGNCSNEVVQTTNAWAAVGVGPIFSGPCLNLEGDRDICTNSTYLSYFYVAEDLPGATFTWSFPPEWTGVTSGTGNNVLNITGFGNYTPPGGSFPTTEFISVTSSLSGSRTMKVTVHDDCQFLCGAGTGSKIASAVHSSASENIEVAIYPNPTKDKLNVVCSGETPVLIGIYSMLGIRLMELVPQESAIQTLDVSAIPIGTYIISVQFKGKSVAKRFSKSN
jgi:bacillolysin